jgi:parallel beta-helix repeat protein
VGKAFSLLGILSLLMSFLILSCEVPSAKTASTITVPDDYATIQEAINNANYGAMIFVRNGTYYGNIVINRTVSLKGEDKTATIIDANKSNLLPLIKVTADHVSISGFTIRRSLGDGILLNDFTRWSIICDNNIVDNSWGIHAWWASEYNEIYGNFIVRNSKGIVLEASVDHCIVSNNTLKNLDEGINLNGADGNLVENNSISDTGIGIWSISSIRNRINYNRISECNTGLALLESDWNNITKNDFNENNLGMWLRSTDGNLFFGNNFINKLQVDVTIPSSWEPNEWANGYPAGGNYWSDYNGTDFFQGANQSLEGEDGIGDTPYNIDENNVDPYPLMARYTPPSQPKSYLTIISSDGGTTEPHPGHHTYLVNASVQVTAIPNKNYLFDHWNLDGTDVGSNNPHMIEMCRNFTLAAIFSPQVNASLEIQPGLLNLKSQARYLTVYIELPKEYDVNCIDISSIVLNDTIEIDPGSQSRVGDYNSNSIPDLMVNFNRTRIKHYIFSNGFVDDRVVLHLTGKHYNITRFRARSIFEGNSILKVSLLSGDVNCDAKVNIQDIILAAHAYSSNDGDQNWNPNTNFAQPWNIIDLFDIVTITYHYGEESTP